MAEAPQFKHYRVVNAGGPRVVHHRGGSRLLEKGASFVGEFDVGSVTAMQRPGRMLHLTEASAEDVQAAPAKESPRVPEGAQDQFDAMSDDDLRAHIEATGGHVRGNARRETLLRRARGEEAE